ncbi:MAG: sigma-54-dependent Fis family transcriptional regulator [Planctomycetota bacterium]|nr:MAG: sigma-54-dependent Fis family transcriptional regulator [Planctomycetota bacterium]REJ91735.1 MAG: sigma-54-dependent Fis family transcriptional regulator [Planctomycetota bacterium]REK27197.1 MAG: sigma-54-dependent Fis family transcriptional regulator [Planctomycetota bacterium]REK36782.1 MAG: sigma-54-dependent Fis family transcriptional regulator [Planctomycetota bacterium]
MATLLIVDDEPNMLYSLEKGLRQEGLTVRTASTAQAGIDSVREHQPDAVLLDVQLPDLSGIDALEQMRSLAPKLPVVIMTAHGTADTAIEAMKRGAFDYVLKPWKLAELKQIVAGALHAGRLSRVPAIFEDAPQPDLGDCDRIVGRSPQMQDVFKEIGRVAPQDVSVLILGESGTGKELVARAIYHHSRRADQPFLAINCAAIPESLLESELLGHERGAFTGADRQRIGKFEQAHRGTLFLDEIGEMAAATQAKLLRILQDGRFERVGGNQTIETDVRIIAATNKDIDEAVREQEFRRDLYYRLNTFTIRLPPLRERRDDIPALTQHFLQRDRHRLGIDVRGIDPDAMTVLENHSWPGNVRELESAIRYGLVHTTGDVMTAESLPANVTGDSQPAGAGAAQADDDLSDVRRRVKRLIAAGEQNLNDIVHADVDRVLLDEVLSHVDGHQARAAEMLGISRTTLRARIQQLGLTIEKSVRANQD